MFDRSQTIRALVLLLLLAPLAACTSKSAPQAPEPSGTGSDTGTSDATDGGTSSTGESTANTRNVYPEPAVDTSLPVGTPNPPFQGELPAEPRIVERTGTYGGTLVYSILGEVETFNPVEPKGATAQELRSLAFSSLVDYSNGDWEAEPLLAKSWEVSDDYKTWTFYLREGVRWSDGEPLTIDDVDFSFRAIFHPQIATSIRDGFTDEEGRLPTFEIDREKNAIIFTTHEVDSQFVTHVGNVSIIPEHKWRDHLQDENPTLLQQMLSNARPEELVGSGPFKLKQYLTAEKVEYVRNPYYWEVDARGNRLPYVDRVVIALLKDQNLQVAKFLAGEHHLLDTLPADRFDEVARASEAEGATFDLLRLGVSLTTYWICFNLHPGIDAESGEPFLEKEKQGWFHELEFRAAVNHAIDRGAIVKAAFQGRARPIWASITPGNRKWYARELPRYEHDQKIAREKLDALGYTDRNGDGIREDAEGNKISFTLNTNVENNIRAQVGSLVKNQLADVGIEVNFRPIDFNGLVTRLQDSHDWDMILLGWASGVPPDPSNSKNINRSGGRLHAWYPQQPEPATEWEARVDELVGLLDRTIEFEQRKEYSDEIQRLVAENLPILYLVSPNQYSLAKREVGNLWPSPLRPQVTWNIQELFLRPDAGTR